MINANTEFEVPMPTGWKDMKSDKKAVNGVVWATGVLQLPKTRAEWAPNYLS